MEFSSGEDLCVLLGDLRCRSGEKSSPKRDDEVQPLLQARSGEVGYPKRDRGFSLGELTRLKREWRGGSGMCLMVGHMMGMELVEFPSATNGRGVLSMVITCVECTMGKELLCSRRLLLGEESIVWAELEERGGSTEFGEPRNPYSLLSFNQEFRVERLSLPLRRETLAQARSRGNLDVLSATSRPGERFWGFERRVCSFRCRSGEKSSPKRDDEVQPLLQARSGEVGYPKRDRGFSLGELTRLKREWRGGSGMCLMVGHMMGMELVEFPSATNGRGVLSMVITCVECTMGKELLCSRRLLLGEESIVCMEMKTHVNPRVYGRKLLLWWQKRARVFHEPPGDTYIFAHFSGFQHEPAGDQGVTRQATYTA
ncbi:hypothetical protein DEO72_LG6g849 [Vigna unguiculata]|uniref:Uncharacterized protein n=1 Tax=Vigna unguiculata TaxID=3917 RepID=A0A4D6M5N2_VIGUN|nr:hypothetical protein DEO72_LG6g849 [Vigna unguiculata]